MEKHQYKKGFYDDLLKRLALDIKNQKLTYKNADYLTFGYSPMKEMIIKRYPDLNLEKKIILSPPMTFSKGSLFFSTSIRNTVRKKLGVNDSYLMIYIGNAYYSWQNVYRTIEIFQLIKSNLNKCTFLILLIRKKDFPIVNEFIDQLKLRPNEYLLTNVHHEEIYNYLNAADIGISLRHNHIMNETTPSGKILEYLGCGLPVLTTQAMGEISTMVEKNRFGVVLKNMDDDNEVIKKITPFIEHNESRRIEISKWANENISMDANINKYVEKLNERCLDGG